MKDHLKKDFENIAARQLFKARKALAASADFTYAGLKALHSKTFADTYGHEQKVSDYFAEYDRVRHEGADWEFWRKEGRPVAGLESSLSIYSNMRSSDIKRTERAMARCHPQNMASLTFLQKTECLAEMYCEIDYTHAFAEGNSRVNRIFVSEVARASGLETDWSKVSRKNMYIARDKALAQAALKHRGADMRNYAPQLAQLLQYDKKLLETIFPGITLQSVFRSVLHTRKAIRRKNPANGK